MMIEGERFRLAVTAAILVVALPAFMAVAAASLRTTSGGAGKEYKAAKDKVVQVKPINGG
jgi:hypothetical protein